MLRGPLEAAWQARASATYTKAVAATRVAAEAGKAAAGLRICASQMVDDKASEGALKRAGAQCDAMTQSAPAAGAGRKGSVLHAVLPPAVPVKAPQPVPHPQRPQRDVGPRGEPGHAGRKSGREGRS